MKTQVLVGRFLKSNGDPVEGLIRFVPSEMWDVDKDGIAWALLSPTQELEDGRFEVELSVGEYFVYSPLGRWVIRVKESDGPGYLSSHLPSNKT